MKSNLMIINKKEFLQIMNSYLSNEEGEKISCKVKYDHEENSLIIYYYKYVNINGSQIRIFVELNKDDIYDILSKLIQDYEIIGLYSNIKNNKLTRISISLQDRQKTMKLEK